MPRLVGASLTLMLSLGLPACVIDSSQSGGYGYGTALPQGSWRGTCRDAYMEGSILYAQCSQRDGDWKRASLDLRRCYGAPVVNANGRLECSQQAASGALPPGPWRQSCRDGQVRGDVLYAVCRQDHGDWKRAKVYLPECVGRPISNDNGRLVCQLRAEGNLPAGSWRQSCRDGYLRGRVLYAVCRQRDGDWKNASLDMRSCRLWAAVNANGRLLCE